MKKIVIKNKIVLTVVAAILFSTYIGLGFAINSKDKITTPEKVLFDREIILEYGEDIKDRKYKMLVDKEEVLVNLSEDLDPVVDTMDVGETKHTVKDVEGEITVKVEDTEFPVVSGELAFFIALTDDLDLEAVINDKVSATDLIDGEIELEFKVPADLEVGENRVTVKATDSNGNYTEVEIMVIVVSPEDFEEVDNNTDKDDESTDNDKDTGKTDKDTSKLVVDNKPKPDVQKPTGAPVITWDKIVSYEDIAFVTDVKYDSSKAKGTEVVVQDGVVGQDKIVTTIKLSDGKEVSRSHERLRVKNPVSNIVVVGTYVEPEKPKDSTAAVFTSGSEIAKMVNGINDARKAIGLNSLSVSTELQRGAGIRAPEIVVSFSHTRPDGSSWSTVSRDAYGENLAWGSADGNTTHESFMNSPGHKANILNTRWQTVGIATTVSGYNTYWVVLFGE